jgi:hypothetical protein
LRQLTHRFPDAGLSLPKRSAIFGQRLPEHEQRHDGRPQSLANHFDKSRIGAIFNAHDADANSQLNSKSLMAASEWPAAILPTVVLYSQFLAWLQN